MLRDYSPNPDLGETPIFGADVFFRSFNASDNVCSTNDDIQSPLNPEKRPKRILESPNMAAGTLTQPDGPVVVSEMTFAALAAIRRLKLIPTIYTNAVMGRENYEAVRHLIDENLEATNVSDSEIQERGFAACPALPWLFVAPDQPEQLLPERVTYPGNSSASEAATLRLGIGIPASLILIDGPIKERAKLSFIKCEGTVSILVSAYREGHLSAVRPMVIALEKLGHGHVLPPPDLLKALWTALDKL